MDGEISVDELEALLAAGEDVRVVDIRQPAAFDRGHIPGSENIPFSELPQSVDRLDGAERVVTVCPHGQASVQAARLVQSYEGLAEDARVESLAEGITGWEGEIEASERDDEGPDTESATDAPF
ncbi:rhodanese-like domain-containing protein [Halobacterium sp. R2-5]|uniref:rhodanese-like domain-containing protein n=1 Tax=Halobacterium sp. R2-5 TaxID=2715751 RepID=UPI00141EC0C8|nr:rhodanese-like domain-containing protein [Halobacterium sp. R2-5]NIB98380.1 rhodanese-like domain-containing protein [Halobacterium sp. R2-5]